jgi:hypothetical protein
MIGEMAVRKNLEPEDLVEAGVGFTREHPVWEKFAIFPVNRVRPHRLLPRAHLRGRAGRHDQAVPHGAGGQVWGALLALQSRRAAPDQGPTGDRGGVDSQRDLSPQIFPADWLHRGGARGRFQAPGQPEQFYKLSKLKTVRDVCLLFDHDAIGHAWKDARQFVGRFKISVAEMPAGAENNARLDPNDDVELAWEVFQKRSPTTLQQRFLSNKGLNLFANEARSPWPDFASTKFLRVDELSTFR